MNSVNPNVLARKHRRIGEELYIARQPLSACQNEQQRAGWLSANAAEGECATPNYASKAGW